MTCGPYSCLLIIIDVGFCLDHAVGSHIYCDIVLGIPRYGALRSTWSDIKGDASGSDKRFTSMPDRAPI
jgi:hypothetical protein